MEQYSLPKYDQARAWIKKSRERDIEWDDIFLARKKDETELKAFLADQVDSNFWPELSVDDWKAIVALEKTAEERVLTLRRMREIYNGFGMRYNGRKGKDRHN